MQLNTNSLKRFVLFKIVSPRSTCINDVGRVWNIERLKPKAKFSHKIWKMKSELQDLSSLKKSPKSSLYLYGPSKGVDYVNFKGHM